MSNQKRGYDSTVARIAGNVASGLIGRGTYDGSVAALARQSVIIAREIVAETARTEVAAQSSEEPTA